MERVGSLDEDHIRRISINLDLNDELTWEVAQVSSGTWLTLGRIGFNHLRKVSMEVYE